MARATAKTVRFSQVVERAGQPRVHTPWVAPEKDPEFKRAQQAHRVMRIEAGIAGKKDVGLIDPKSANKPGGQFLIFPKSLKRFEGARVVGIKFDLIAQPNVAELPAQVPKGPGKKKSRRPPKPVPDPKRRAKETAGKPDSSEIENVVPFAREAAPPAPTRAPAAKPPKRPRSKPSRTDVAADRASDTALVRAVRAAMKDLQRGKSVAAYRRLERALS